MACIKLPRVEIGVILGQLKLVIFHSGHVREVGCQLPVAVYLFNRQLANGS